MSDTRGASRYNLAALICLLVFAVLVVDGFGSRFFSPECGHNDVRQQLFQFYRAIDPQIFSNDLIFNSMRSYLPPLHYQLGIWITKLTGNPLVTAHVLMSVQILVSGMALFGTVRKLAGTYAGCLAVIWFLNCRSLLSLMAGGLPRGWITPVLATYLYFLVSSGAEREWRIWIVLFVGALLNPVATFIALLTQSLLHGVRFVFSVDRAGYFRGPLVLYGVVALAISAIVWITTARPPELGSMATLVEASRLQGFSKLGGRFPILPFASPWQEFSTVGLQVFTGWSFERPDAPSKLAIYGVLAAFLGLVGLLVVRVRGGYSPKVILPPELVCFGAAIGIGYVLSRQFAFALYIPDRYLGSPLGLFFVAFVTVALWNLLVPRRGDQQAISSQAAMSQSAKSVIWKPYLCAAASLGVLIAAAGPGVNGPQLFDTCYRDRGPLWDFLRTSTPRDSLVAGHPTTLDGVQIFGQRSGFITAETAHPFYDVYYREVKRRIMTVLTAHYAQDWRTFYDLLAKEGVDYFVFRASDFTAEGIKRSRYEIPFLNLSRRLAAHPLNTYAYSTLPQSVDSLKFPFFVLRTKSEAVIDIKALGAYLATVHS